ncbi:MAG: class II glutamine amidotransferase [Rhodocyclaceae bacterium]|nr:class II glutamine amidotransferase [Rhodocyclaceae bacterium]
MCELFGASASAARGYSSWLLPFRARGGETADNPDGWGIASWANDQATIEKSPQPGWHSERFRELAESVNSRLLLAHVRKARHPPIPGLLNTHPFAHACCGREWVFAHNGMVPDVVEQPCTGAVCHPEGETDSELAFCHLLAGIVDAYDAADIDRWLGQLATRATAIASLGKFNFLLSDGSVLIAHGHDRLHYSERPAGLALVATEPLDAGDWRAFAPGELRVYRDGILLASQLETRS